jgi:hypothetical protein
VTAPMTASVTLPWPTDLTAVRRCLAQGAPNVGAVRAWTRRVLADHGGRGGGADAVPALGSRAWCALPDGDPRKLAAAVRPALAQLEYWEPAAIADRLRTELDEFATAWRRACVEASHDLSGAGRWGVGPTHADLVRRRQLASTEPCGTCGTAVTLVHPLPDEYAARLPDLGWVSCSDCTPAAGSWRGPADPTTPAWRAA